MVLRCVMCMAGPAQQKDQKGGRHSGLALRVNIPPMPTGQFGLMESGVDHPKTRQGRKVLRAFKDQALRSHTRHCGKQWMTSQGEKPPRHPHHPHHPRRRHGASWLAPGASSVASGCGRESVVVTSSAWLASNAAAKWSRTSPNTA